MGLNKMNDWVVAVSPWIINDGNYSEFFAGQVVEFGLHLQVKDVKITNSAEKMAVSMTRNQYQFVGEITYVADNFCILDLGIEGYSKFGTTPNYAELGQHIEGQIKILLDDFFLSYTLANTPHPPLIHTWRINQVVTLKNEKVTPVVFEKNSRGVEVGRYIHSEEKQTVVPRTDASSCWDWSFLLIILHKIRFSSQINRPVFRQNKLLNQILSQNG